MPSEFERRVERLEREVGAASAKRRLLERAPVLQVVFLDCEDGQQVGEPELGPVFNPLGGEPITRNR